MRDIGFDVQQVEVYLKEHPQPTRETLRNFTHKNIIPEQWDTFVNCDDDVYLLEVLKRAGAPPIEGLPRVSLKDMYVKDVGHAVELEECVVTGISTNRPEAYQATSVCLTCGQDKKFPIEPGMVTLKAPKWQCECSEPTHVENVLPEDMIDTQWIRLEEVRRDTTISRVPISIPARIQGHGNLWSVQFKERVRPIGAVRSQMMMDKNKRRYFTFWFEVFGIRRVKDAERDFELTDEDRTRFRYEMEQPQYPEKLRGSIAPHIAGNDIIKDAVLLVLASIGLIHPIKVFIIGDPGTGKSQVAKFGSLLLRDSWYVNMAQARATGLTTTSAKDPDSDAWMVHPGIFAMADGSAVWLDDLQEARDPKDITALLEVLQDGRISYALAGGNVGYLDARAAVMALCNPRGGYIGLEQNIHELVGFIKEGRAALLSRFSMILKVVDKKSDAEEAEIAGRIYDHSQVDIMEYYKNDWTKKIKTESGEEVEVEYFGVTTLRKLIKFIIEEIPVDPMPPDFKEDFIKYYLANKRDYNQQHRMVMTPRFVEHCVSIAQVWARLFGKSQPTKEHVMFIFNMLTEHMALAAFDPKTQQYDVGMIEGAPAQRTIQEQKMLEVSEKSQKEQFIWACKEAMKMTEDADKFFTKELLKMKLQEIPKHNWGSTEKISKWLEEGVGAGKVETKGERYRWAETLEW